MSELKTVEAPITNSPNFDALQVAMFRSTKVTKHVIGNDPALVEHICAPSTDYVIIYVPPGTGVLIYNGDLELLGDDNAWELAPGYHPWGLPDGLKTLYFYVQAAPTYIRIMEVG